MEPLLIENGRVIDPANGVDAVCSVLCRNRKIVFVGPAAEAAAREEAQDARRIDAAGCIVAPGFIDMHVHLRDPGDPEEETIASGAKAAVAGGFTGIACMPNTDPALDSESDITFVLREARKARAAWVYPVGAVTVGRQGEALASMAQMHEAGAVAFSDDGNAVPTPSILKSALTYARMFDMPIMDHCEDASLKGGGLMNAGDLAVRLGLPGNPNAAEALCVARDVILAKMTKARLHIQHVSTADAVELVRRAKADGIAVTAEATPHHLTLTEDCLRDYNPIFKVAPPLRAEADRLAVVAGLVDGTIDAIATDHAPHRAEKKEGEFATAAFGMLGLETAVGVLSTDLVRKGALTWPRMVEALTVAPARILRLDARGKGALTPGFDADITIVDPEKAWTVDPDKFHSRSRNCPYRGRVLTGRVRYTVVTGVVVYDDARDGR